VEECWLVYFVESVGGEWRGEWVKRGERGWGERDLTRY